MSVPVQPDAVPDDLREVSQWGLWKTEYVRDKPTKVPYQLNGKRASSTEPSQWCEFEQAADAYTKHPKHWSGLAFFFHESDPFVGIDLDNCLTLNYGVKEWARAFIERFADTYQEISPSGTGIKIWVRGKLPSAVGGISQGDGQIEMYDSKRFFAVTGRIFRGAPRQVEDHAGDILLLYELLNRNRPNKWQYTPRSDGKIPHGQQHLTLVSICGTLRNRGVCDSAILACLMEVNKSQCEQPGPEENIRRIVSSTTTWKQRQ